MEIRNNWKGMEDLKKVRILEIVYSIILIVALCLLFVSYHFAIITPFSVPEYWLNNADTLVSGTLGIFFMTAAIVLFVVSFYIFYIRSKYREEKEE